MISEKQLSESFDSFWQHYFPLLNPTFVRRFNAEKERVVGRNGRPIPPVPIGKDVERFDLVAELAFEMARENYVASTGGIADHAAAIRRAVSRMEAIVSSSEIPKPSVAELQEAQALLGVYDDFFTSVCDSEQLSFRPRIKGAGILSAMEADLCSRLTLYEVKAVNRNLQSGDVKQVVCYLVAGYGSRQYFWTDYCIFNPRLAVVYSGKIDELLAYLSGRPPYDCVAEVLDALMEREQPLESRF